jgi:hypothetical protein
MRLPSRELLVCAPNSEIVLAAAIALAPVMRAFVFQSLFRATRALVLFMNALYSFPFLCH